MIILILLKAALLFRQEIPLFRVRFLWISQRVLCRNLIPTKFAVHKQKHLTEH